VAIRLTLTAPEVEARVGEVLRSFRLPHACCPDRLEGAQTTANASERARQYNARSEAAMNPG
jgi:hypothetical protein